MVQFLLSVLILCWFTVSVRNRNPFLNVYFQDPRSKVLGRIRSCSSLQKFDRVTYCTRGVFFYLKPFMNILHFGSPLSRRDVGFESRDISTSRRQFVPPLERRDVGSQRRDVGCFPLWNIAKLHSHVATLTMFKAKPPLFLLLPCSLLP